MVITVVHPDATKQGGLRALREHVTVDHVVAFGDQPHDLDLFDEADHAVAVSNAEAEVRERADLVIGEAGDDAVARYLDERFES